MFVGVVVSNVAVGSRLFLATGHRSVDPKSQYPLMHIFEFRASAHRGAARGSHVAARRHFRNAVTRICIFLFEFPAYAHRAALWVVNNKVAGNQMWAYAGVCGTVKCNLV